MSGGMADHEDETLLGQLAALVERLDPAPSLAYELGRAALSWRTADVELAELVADSSADAPLVRGPAAAVRVLSFEAESLSVEVQVSGGQASRSLLGQVIPEPAGPGGVVQVETSAGLGPAAPLDDLGRFEVAAVPGPTIRFRVEMPGLEPVTTVWVSL